MGVHEQLVEGPQNDPPMQLRNASASVTVTPVTDTDS